MLPRLQREVVLVKPAFAALSLLLRGLGKSLSVQVLGAACPGLAGDLGASGRLNYIPLVNFAGQIP